MSNIELKTMNILDALKPADITDEEWDSRAHYGFRGGNMTIINLGNSYINIAGKCVMSGKHYVIHRILIAHLNMWLNEDRMIQDALSQLSADDRGFLLNGICPEARAKMEESFND